MRGFGDFKMLDIFKMFEFLSLLYCDVNTLLETENAVLNVLNVSLCQGQEVSCAG